MLRFNRLMWTANHNHAALQQIHLSCPTDASQRYQRAGQYNSFPPQRRAAPHREGRVVSCRVVSCVCGAGSLYRCVGESAPTILAVRDYDGERASGRHPTIILLWFVWRLVCMMCMAIVVGCCYASVYARRDIRVYLCRRALQGGARGCISGRGVHPFNTGCLPPLNHSGNPGANVSYREGCP